MLYETKSCVRFDYRRLRLYRLRFNEQETKCACVGAAAGAAVGATAGVIIGNQPHFFNANSKLVDGLIGGGAGALIGGITGYFVCKEEPKPQPQPVRWEEPTCDKIVLNSVQFDFDKAVIKPEFYPVLDEVAGDCGSAPKRMSSLKATPAAGF